jgi:hypothetical protein
MLAGNNVHIFARPMRRDALKWLFETVLQCGPVAMRTVLEAGLKEVKHPGHPYYFMAPAGQVFTIVPIVIRTRQGET